MDDEFAGTSYDCPGGAPVGVFPADAAVLFVQTDYVGGGEDGAVGGGDGAVEILGDWLVVLQHWRMGMQNRRGEILTLMTPRQSQPSSRLFAQFPAPPSPKSKACLR